MDLTKIFKPTKRKVILSFSIFILGVLWQFLLAGLAVNFAEAYGFVFGLGVYPFKLFFAPLFILKMQWFWINYLLTLLWIYLLICLWEAMFSKSRNNPR